METADDFDEELEDQDDPTVCEECGRPLEICPRCKVITTPGEQHYTLAHCEVAVKAMIEALNAELAQTREFRRELVETLEELDGTAKA